MKILAINSGSSSLKLTLFDFKKTAVELAKIHLDGIGQKNCRFTFKSADKNIGQNMHIKNHEAGLKFALQLLQKHGPIKNPAEIDRVGHRVVHGGEKYTKASLIDAQLIKTVEKLSNLAPLHNPINLETIKACKKLLPRIWQIAVFDTAFHQTMPEKAFLYGLPYKLYEKEKIRRYGFHGINHQYVTEKTLKLLKKKNPKIISCHLGNGSSITASINGKSIDTSMGFTPLEGVIMGTRSGSIDPAITFHLQHNLKMKPDSVDHLLNYESGLLGLSGISSDMRDIYHSIKKNHEKAQLAIEILAYQIAKYCGAYAAAMQGLDAIIFTGGLGEKAFYVREKVCEYLNFLSIKLDKKKNEKATKIEDLAEISHHKSKIKIFVIAANEAMQIAKETKNF
ncbi:acetate kinase [Candidatus Peregrinibacteria bacterium]|nr:acetate kinase [Candidatus Peregrinibacteria bacterium]